MAKSRNERRKLAQERLNAKTIRLVKADIGARLDKNRAIVRQNMTFGIERNYYPETSMRAIEGGHYFAKPSERQKASKGLTYSGPSIKGV